MKNRRLAITSFLLIAVLIMGIGFAAIADNLNIGGTARVTTDGTAKEFDSQVYFSNAVILKTTGTSGNADTASVTGTEKDTVELKVHSLATMGQSVTFKMTITNESTQYDAVISLDAGMPNGTMTNPSGAKFNDYFNVTYSTSPDGVITSDIICPAKSGANNGTIDVYVTVTLVSSPLTTVDATFSSNLTATAQAKAQVNG